MIRNKCSESGMSVRFQEWACGLGNAWVRVAEGHICDTLSFPNVERRLYYAVVMYYIQLTC